MKRLFRRLVFFVTRFKSKYNLLPTYSYRVGDKVKYNWKAKIILGDIINDRSEDVLIIHEVKHKRNEFINYQNTRTKKRGWVDAYWLTRASGQTGT